MANFDEMLFYHPTPARSGNAAIEHFLIPENMSFAMRLASELNDSPEEWTPPGHYVRLSIDGQTWMSDARMEKDTNQRFVDEAKGHVLIAGLGIGLILPPLQRKKDVRSITVLERSEDVAKIVAPRFRKFDKLSVVLADVYEFKPTMSYDTIYFDIWPDRSPDNLPAMRKLHNRYRPFLKAGGFMESWYRQEIIAVLRRHRKARRNFARLGAGSEITTEMQLRELLRRLNELDTLEDEQEE